ncbi:hypothetical protein [Nostoc sp.]|uniref:hypothetical protein n=1 Tax=Nostoc sp. TaxID=1180 RepID=UPI002FEEE5A1
MQLKQLDSEAFGSIVSRSQTFTNFRKNYSFSPVNRLTGFVKSDRLMKNKRDGEELRFETSASKLCSSQFPMPNSQFPMLA